jgi:hypothetical protein
MIRYGKMLQILRGELTKPLSVRAGNLVQVIVMSILIDSIVAPTTGNLKIGDRKLSGYKIGGLHAHIDGMARFL